MDKCNKLKEKARADFKHAKSLQEQSGKKLMSSRHNLDIAEAALEQAQDVLKAADASEDSQIALDVKDKHQKYLDEENKYQQAKAGNEKFRNDLEETRAKFVEVFGEEP